jgi:hypothetical protein
MQIEPNATKGTTRQINKANRNTAEVVNSAITAANEADLDLAYAETYLRYQGPQ